MTEDDNGQRRPHRNPTIKDVARAAGVSSATVSYVLNNLNKVTPEVDSHVREVAARLGYSRNNAARALKTGQMNVIGCILPTLVSPVFPEIAQAVQARAESYGYATFVVDSGQDHSREEKASELLLRHGVDGAVAVLSASPRKRLPPAFPLVVLDQRLEGLDSVRADHWIGGRLMADELVRIGHRRVGLLSGEQSVASSLERREGFLDGARGRLKIIWDIEVPLRPQLNDEAIVAISSAPRHGVTAIACANDLVAIGALGILHNNRIRVPDDISVIGFDGMEWSGWPLVDLTTVRQPLAELGGRAVDILMARLAEPDRPLQQVALPVELVRRGSTAAPAV
ncbi:LacI family DNA-binding transcriptional regulator [Rhizobium daejeonense]